MMLNHGNKHVCVTSSQGTAKYASDFHKVGYAIIPKAIGHEFVHRLRAALEEIPDSNAVRRRKNVYGVRTLLEISSEVRELAASESIRRFVTPILGESAFATRAVFFDKVPDANWALGWHQDSVIAVKERRDVSGFIAWGQKAGVWQVQPPPEILANMVAIRVHLDDCGADNGPLRVLPGSHRCGWLDNDIGQWKRRVAEVACIVPVGGIVAMCPLLLHASSKANEPGHRRVIHIEYTNAELPGGLEWNLRVGG